jgi:hypothetical protein
MVPVLATGASLGAGPQFVAAETKDPRPALQAASPPPPQALNNKSKLNNETLKQVFTKALLFSKRILSVHRI